MRFSSCTELSSVIYCCIACKMFFFLYPGPVCVCLQMHPFASHVLRCYYKATGWNEDNLYANLTRSSNGMWTVHQQETARTDALNSHSRFHRPSRINPLGVPITQFLVQDIVLDECYAISEWIGGVHLHIVPIGRQDVRNCAVQRHGRSFQDAWTFSAT